MRSCCISYPCIQKHIDQQHNNAFYLFFSLPFLSPRTKTSSYPTTRTHCIAVVLCTVAQHEGRTRKVLGDKGGNKHVKDEAGMCSSRSRLTEAILGPSLAMRRTSRVSSGPVWVLMKLVGAIFGFLEANAVQRKQSPVAYI